MWRAWGPQTAVPRDRGSGTRRRTGWRIGVRGIEGHGGSSLIHTTRLLSLSEDPPIAIVIVDDAQRVRAFLPRLDELFSEGLVLIDDVEVIRYSGRDAW